MRLSSSRLLAPNSEGDSCPVESKARLDVAMPVRPDRGAGEGDPSPGHRPVRGDPEDLAAQRAEVLGALGHPLLAGGDPQQSTGSERQLPAVVDRALWDAGKDHLRRAEGAARGGHAMRTTRLSRAAVR